MLNMKGGRIVWGKNVYVGPNAAISGVLNLTFGNDVYIGKNVTIEVEGIIGNGCIIANNVGIVGRRDHDPNFPGDMFYAPVARKDASLRDFTVIEDGVWLGFGSIIMSGVRVGKRSIVAAGAIVTKDVPPYSLVIDRDQVKPRTVRS